MVLTDGTAAADSVPYTREWSTEGEDYEEATQALCALIYKDLAALATECHVKMAALSDACDILTIVVPTEDVKEAPVAPKRIVGLSADLSPAR
jgi:hypothetical protein